MNIILSGIVTVRSRTKRKEDYISILSVEQIFYVTTTETIVVLYFMKYKINHRCLFSEYFYEWNLIRVG